MGYQEDVRPERVRPKVMTIDLEPLVRRAPARALDEHGATDGRKVAAHIIG